MTQVATHLPQSADAKKPTAAFTVAVVGDIAHQLNLYLPSPDPASTTSAPPARFIPNVAGAAIIQKLLAQVAQQAHADSPIFTAALFTDGHSPSATLGCLWQPKPLGKLAKSQKTTVWRPTQS